MIQAGETDRGWGYARSWSNYVGWVTKAGDSLRGEGGMTKAGQTIRVVTKAGETFRGRGEEYDQSWSNCLGGG